MALRSLQLWAAAPSSRLSGKKTSFQIKRIFVEPIAATRPGRRRARPNFSQLDQPRHDRGYGAIVRFRDFLKINATSNFGAYLGVLIPRPIAASLCRALLLSL